MLLSISGAQTWAQGNPLYRNDYQETIILPEEKRFSLGDLKIELPNMGNTQSSVYNNACKKFIDPDSPSNLGSWGKEIFSSFDIVFENELQYCLEGNLNPNSRFPDTSDICPNYEYFTTNLKKVFWVWVFANIAQAETSCGTLIRAQGINDLAFGMFQLENSYQARRRAGRDPLFCGTRGPVMNDEFLSKEFQVQCSLSILKDTSCHLDYFYWQKMRESEGSRGWIWEKSRTFPLCNA